MARTDRVDVNAKSAAFALALALAACSHVPAQPAASETPYDPVRTHTVKVGAGIGCTGSGALGPVSYSVYDLGKTGVPKLNARDAEMLHTIMRYVHPSTLRFAYLNGGKLFAVMDMSDGPCTGSQVGVLSAPGCDMITVPYDGMGHVFASSGCWSAARPWFPGEHDGQHPIPWTQYDNNH